MAKNYTHQIPQAYNLPLTVNKWNPLINAPQVQSSYTSPVPQTPVAIASSHKLTSPYLPYTVVPESVMNTVVNVTPEVYRTTSDVYCNISPDAQGNVTPDLHNNAAPNGYGTTITDVYSYTNDYNEAAVISEQTAESAMDETEKDPVESYLTLSKELFPPAKNMNIDPNAIIDEFCKLPRVSENVPWILDIEFGVPRAPVTRSIAVYDVKLNSVHCKNTPTAIHPGFKKCNSHFKKVVLLYYDCVVSTWYKGYVFMNSDKSVENFQSWLLIPMQIFGMCWP